MLDVLIRGARVIDGTGAPEFTGDVAITGDRIAAVGAGIDEPAERVVDAAGRVVCPGFIDLHSHVDFVLQDYPRADGMLRQGVTTIVTGNCGMSPFPTLPGNGAVAGWADLAAFTAELSAAPLAVNAAPMVGHSAVRTAAMSDPGGEPSPGERGRMAELVDEAMRHGAHGISSGLIYDPGRFADTAELAELAAVAARHGGFYASHIRGEADTLVAAVEEALTIGRTSGAPVQLSHHKAKRRRNWGTVTTTLAMVADAVRSGIDVTLDCYPYTASSTSLWAYLPHWARADDVLAAGTELPEQLRRRLVAELERMYPGSSGRDGARTDLSDLTISHVVHPGPYSRYEGYWLDDAAAHAGTSQAEFVLDLLAAGRQVQIIDHAMSDDDMHAVLDHPLCMVGSDARRIHPDIPGLPHPRNFGTFTRFLTHVVPGRMPLETAVRKCTGLPARRMGWQSRRGVLAPGAAADVVMFDPDRLRDHSTFEDPKRYSTGFDLVVVNGIPVVEDDVDTGAAAGRFLLRGSQAGGR